jgi:hypothetical protein
MAASGARLTCQILNQKPEIRVRQGDLKPIKTNFEFTRDSLFYLWLLRYISVSRTKGDPVVRRCLLFVAEIRKGIDGCLKYIGLSSPTAVFAVSKTNGEVMKCWIDRSWHRSHVEGLAV